MRGGGHEISTRCRRNAVLHHQAPRHDKRCKLVSRSTRKENKGLSRLSARDLSIMVVHTVSNFLQHVDTSTLVGTVAAGATAYAVKIYSGGRTCIWEREWVGKLIMIAVSLSIGQLTPGASYTDNISSDPPPPAPAVTSASSLPTASCVSTTGGTCDTDAHYPPWVEEQPSTTTLRSSASDTRGSEGVCPEVVHGAIRNSRRGRKKGGRNCTRRELGV